MGLKPTMVGLPDGRSLESKRVLVFSPNEVVLCYLETGIKAQHSSGAQGFSKTERDGTPCGGNTCDDILGAREL